jgi:hypothetical protein
MRLILTFSFILLLAGCLPNPPVPMDAESVRLRTDYQDCSSLLLSFVPDSGASREAHRATCMAARGWTATTTGPNTWERSK